MVSKAEQAAAKLEALNAQLGQKIERLERLQVERTLGGKAAVQAPTGPTETDAEYAEKVLRGDINGTPE